MDPFSVFLDSVMLTNWVSGFTHEIQNIFHCMCLWVLERGPGLTFLTPPWTRIIYFPSDWTDFGFGLGLYLKNNKVHNQFNVESGSQGTCIWLGYVFTKDPDHIIRLIPAHGLCPLKIVITMYGQN